MAFNITFYKNTAERTYVDKSQYLTMVTTQSVVFKDRTNINAPAIVLKYSQIPNFNYAYIATLKRYYFITDIVSVRNNLWEIYLDIDVLYTYKLLIENLRGVVDRQEKLYNQYIIDNVVPIAQGYDYDEEEIENDIFFKTVQMEDTATFTITGYNLRVTGESSLPTYNEGVWDNVNTKLLLTCGTDRLSVNHIVEDFESIFSNLIGYKEQITAIRYYPFFVTGTSDVLTQDLVSDGVTRYGVKACNPIALKREFFIGEYNIEEEYGNFLDYKGYTYIKCYIPYIGWVDLDTDTFMNSWLRVYMNVDYHTGTARFSVYAAGTSVASNPNKGMLVSSYDTQIGFDLPIGSDNADAVARNIILGAVKAAASIATFAATSSVTATTAVSQTTTEPLTIATRGTEKGSRLKTTYMSSGGGETTTTHTETQHRTSKVPRSINTAIQGATDALNRNYPSTNNDRINNSLIMTSQPTNLIVRIYRPEIRDGLRYGEWSYIQYDDSFFKQLAHIKGRPLGEPMNVSELIGQGYTTFSDIHIEPRGDSTEIYTLYSQMTTEEVDKLENELISGVYL